MSPAENVDETDWALERASFVGQALRPSSGWCRHDNNSVFGWGAVAFWTRRRHWRASKWLYYFTDWLVRALYTCKVIACVFWDRRRNYYAQDAVEVAAWGFRGWSSMDFYGTAYDWWVLAVGRGWRDWHYDVYETSSA